MHQNDALESDPLGKKTIGKRAILNVEKLVQTG